MLMLNGKQYKVMDHKYIMSFTSKRKAMIYANKFNIIDPVIKQLGSAFGLYGSRIELNNEEA